MSVWACSDLHGNYTLFNAIQKFLGKTDRLYIIGDVFDRGPDGWLIYKEIKKDKRIILLKGNHEAMAAGALKGRFGDDSTHGLTEDWSLWANYNGGYPTFQAMREDIYNSNGKLTYESIINELNALPLTAEYLNNSGIKFTLVHSGKLSSDEYECLWDRTHFFQEQWLGKENEVIVHGHSPIPYMFAIWKKPCWHSNIYNEWMNTYEGGALIYCGEHKICLDMGTAVSKQCVILNLDTLDEHIFKEE